MNSGLTIVIVVVGVVYVIGRRLMGEPLNARDLAVPPLVLTGVGVYTLTKVHPLTASDIAWNVGLSVVGLVCGFLRGATIKLFTRDGVLWQRYTPTTLVVWAASLVVSLGLGLLAMSAGLHHEARPMTLSIGIGLIGEMIPIGFRALTSGVPFAPDKDDSLFGKARR